MEKDTKTIFLILTGDDKWMNLHPSACERANHILENMKKYVPLFGDILTIDDLLPANEVFSSFNGIPGYVITCNNLYQQKKISREEYCRILSYDKNLVEWFFRIIPVSFSQTNACHGEFHVKTKRVVKDIANMFYERLSTADLPIDYLSIEDRTVSLLLRESIKRNDLATFDKFFTCRRIYMVRSAVKNVSNTYFLEKILETQYPGYFIRYMKKIPEHKIYASCVIEQKSITLEKYYLMYNNQDNPRFYFQNFVQALYELGISMDFLKERAQLLDANRLREWLHEENI